MPTQSRILLIACSGKKWPVRGPVEAYKLYAGPLWSTLVALVRKNDRRKKDEILEFPFCIALSAKYGFMHDGTKIEPYDLQLTPSRAAGILNDKDALEANLGRHLHGGPAEVFLAGGRFYRETMRRAIELVEPRATILEPDKARGIGDIRRDMAAWIEASPLHKPRLL